MTTTFISWTPEIDGPFRLRYQEITGEEIQLNPPMENGIYTVGSSRLSEEHIPTLKSEFPTLVVSTPAQPEPG